MGGVRSGQSAEKANVKDSDYVITPYRSLAEHYELPMEKKVP